ncbi:uncharacterized protein [Diadema antillarum]|uniref:uncharacterized protein n=1 Tax=Diadema antillarum TaxID=105358 RepID=UPI003A8532E7
MDKKSLRLINSLRELKAAAIKAGLTSEEVENLMLSRCSEETRDQRNATSKSAGASGEEEGPHSADGSGREQSRTRFHVYVASVLCVCIAVGYLHFQGHIQTLFDDGRQMKCLVDLNEFAMEVTRPVSSCEMCEGLLTFPTYQDITREEFLEKHAYTARPALVLEGGTKDWTALDVFSFHFFRDLYRNTENALDSQENCQFFPYITNFDSFEHFLNMSEERAALKGDPWYVGWSNCDAAVSAKLREHYQMPHFLPEGAESSATDWIFMGGPGKGANVHIDNVFRPSWQAQIRGSKTWTLLPPPECEHICHQLTANMTIGNVIIVDTNKWYHKTTIHPGDISITIGSEYD